MFCMYLIINYLQVLIFGVCMGFARKWLFCGFLGFAEAVFDGGVALGETGLPDGEVGGGEGCGVVDAVELFLGHDGDIVVELMQGGEVTGHVGVVDHRAFSGDEPAGVDLGELVEDGIDDGEAYDLAAKDAVGVLLGPAKEGTEIGVGLEVLVGGKGGDALCYFDVGVHC